MTWDRCSRTEPFHGWINENVPVSFGSKREFEIVMSSRDLQKYLIVYQAIVPLVGPGIVFLIIAFGLSLVFPADAAQKVRILGVITFAVLSAAAIVRAVIVLWKTRR